MNLSPFARRGGRNSPRQAVAIGYIRPAGSPRIPPSRVPRTPRKESMTAAVNAERNQIWSGQRVVAPSAFLGSVRPLAALAANFSDTKPYLPRTPFRMDESHVIQDVARTLVSAASRLVSTRFSVRLPNLPAADEWDPRSEKRRHECRRGRHECPRHVAETDTYIRKSEVNPNIRTVSSHVEKNPVVPSPRDCGCAGLRAGVSVSSKAGAGPGFRHQSGDDTRTHRSRQIHFSEPCAL